MEEKNKALPRAVQNDKDLMWTEKGRKIVYRTPVFTVTERHSTGPGNVTGDYIVNEANDWVIVIPVVEDSFLMVKQWRHGEQHLSIEFPGGVLEKGEDPMQGASRELTEETGARNAKLTHLGTLNPNPALFANHVHIFCASEIQFSGRQTLDADEFVNTLLIPKTEVAKKIGTAEYNHALMASALCLYMSAEQQ